MSFSWETIFSRGFADQLQAVAQALRQDVWLLSASGATIWPYASSYHPSPPRWREALALDDNAIGWLAGAGERPAYLRWVLVALTRQIENLVLEQQLQQSQVRLIEEIKAHTELEEALKFMELRALQSQVNPHFLFNTLTTIAGLSILESATQTTELVQSLSRLLRYSLRSIGQMVTLEEELAYVRDYLAIQQARFGDRIRSEIAVGPGVGLAQIPVLTLQPVVENAIIHGLEVQPDGLLQVVAERQGDRVTILVADNGLGIEPARLEEIREMRFSMSGRSHTTGLGLANVHKRLQHFFGSSYGLQLESEWGRGTRVSITLPLLQ